MIKMVVFDLDGTLVDTLGGIANACNYVLDKHGYEKKDLDSYMDFVGNGLAMTIFRALPEPVKKDLIYKSDLGNKMNTKSKDELISKHLDLKHMVGEPDFEIPELKNMIKELLDYYKVNPTIDSKLYDGIEDVLSYLDNNEVLWGIHTNKTASIAKDVADRFIEPSRYVGLKGPNSEIPRKPNPKGSLDLIKEVSGLDISEVIFVGDTEVDIATAKELGVPCILVTYGFRTKEFLSELKPEYLVDSPIEIVDIIKGINS